MNPNRRENIFVNISCNILIPVLILNKGHLFFPSALIGLITALIFPLTYGLWDLLKNKRKNLVSALGLLNVLFTGGLALFKAEGIWFAVKEALFPLLIGVFVLISAYTKKSFFKYMIQQAPIFNWSRILDSSEHRTQQLNTLFKKSTILLSFSFLLSALMNFILALYIFSPAPAALSESQKEILLNQQIADMTWIGFAVIGLPLTLFSFGVLWYFIKKLSSISQLPIKEMFIENK